MELLAILNRVHELDGFADGDCRPLRDGRDANCVEVDVRPRTKDSRDQVPRNVRTRLVSNGEIFPSTSWPADSAEAPDRGSHS